MQEYNFMDRSEDTSMEQPLRPLVLLYLNGALAWLGLKWELNRI